MTQQTQKAIDRRTVLRKGTAVVGTGILGLSGYSLISADEVQAEVTMGTLTITGDNTTLNEPPSSIDVHVTGDYEIIANKIPEKVETILQVHVNGFEGLVDDIGQQTHFDTKTSAYDVTANLFDHKDVSQGYFTPDSNGNEKTTDLLIRVVTRATVDGAIKAESYVEDTAQITIGLNGMEVSLGGEGSVSIIA